MFRMFLGEFDQPDGARRKRFLLFLQIPLDKRQQLIRIRCLFRGKIEFVEKRFGDFFFIFAGCENAVDKCGEIGECLRAVSPRGREGKAFLPGRRIAGKIKLGKLKKSICIFRIV